MLPRLTFKPHPEVLAVALFRRKRRLQSSHGAVVRTCRSRELLLRALLSRWTAEIWGNQSAETRYRRQKRNQWEEGVGDTKRARPWC